MTTITIPDELAERLQEIAKQENRPIEVLLESLLTRYNPTSNSEPTEEVSLSPALEAYSGSLDTDITDLSTTVRETMAELYEEKYGDTD